MVRHPMKENETRVAQNVHADAQQDLRHRAKVSNGIETVIMGDGSTRSLLRVEQTTKVDGKPKPEFDIKVWVDSDGQVLKQEQDLLGGYIQYRTTKKAAQSPGGPFQFDLIAGTVIKIASTITNPDRTRNVQYRITLSDGDPAQRDSQRFTPDRHAGRGQEVGDSRGQELGALGRRARHGRSRSQYLRSPMCLLRATTARYEAWPSRPRAMSSTHGKKS